MRARLAAHITRSLRRVCWLMLLFVVTGPRAFAQETGKEQDMTFIDAARAYTIRPIQGSATYSLQELEALRWSNPVRGSAAGTVFIWTNRGRPVAAASMYRYGEATNAKIDHEFVSLSDQGFIAELSGTKVWTPSLGGIRWTTFETAPAPAPTRPARLTQMRLVASRFEGTLIHNGERDRLRLLTQPIYRFPESPSSDGAIFALAQATDPEILLLIDVDLGASPAKYRYAAARMSANPLQLSYDGTTVLNLDKWPWGSTEPDQPYLTRINVPVTTRKEK